MLFVIDEAEAVELGLTLDQGGNRRHLDVVILN
jgi:hypothetical protein